MLAQVGLTGQAEMTVEHGAIVLRKPSKAVRSGWSEAAQLVAKRAEDELLMAEFSNSGDPEHSSAEIGDDITARPVRKTVKQVPLAEVKDDFSRYLKEAAAREIVITRHGKPAGVLIGFESEHDWLEYRLENDPRFLKRIAKARASLRAGRGVPLEDLE